MYEFFLLFRDRCITYYDFIFFSLPPYPSSNLTNCIIMKSNILDSNNPIQGQYYVFVNEDPPYYARKTFNCNNNFEQ